MNHDLDLWLYGTRTARVREPRSGKLTLTFTDDALDRWGLASPILSLSMITGATRFANSHASPWIEGLLPEGHARTAIERAVDVRRGDTFALLAEIGREVAGAACFLRPGELPHSIQADSDTTLAEVVELAETMDLVDAIGRLDEHPLGVDEHVRVSLAGLQDKLLLVDQEGGGWSKPTPAQPSTHILKPENALFPGLAVNEAVCLQTAKSLGLTSIDVTVSHVEDRPALIVSRYDRVVDKSGRIERLHQEDLCQAFSIPADREAHKYETAGGPSLRMAARLLDRWSRDGQDEMTRLLRLAVFNVAVGNADAHGKNISILHPADGSITLAPAYDIASTTQWRTVLTPAGERPVSRRMAMSVDAEFDIDKVTLSHFNREARSWPLLGALDIAQDLLERFPVAVEEAGKRFNASDELMERLIGRAGALINGLPSGAGDHHL